MAGVGSRRSSLWVEGGRLAEVEEGAGVEPGEPGKQGKQGWDEGWNEGAEIAGADHGTATRCRGRSDAKTSGRVQIWSHLHLGSGGPVLTGSSSFSFVGLFNALFSAKPKAF